ncbi:MAG: glycosyltransferase family 2 protein [Flavisolibacter sp.]
MAYSSPHITPTALTAFRTYEGLEKKQVVHGTLDPTAASLHPVSAVLITLNEESIIEQTLSKLWWCDEIIIIDSGSTDRTVEICKQFGCSLIIRAFTGFGDQKRFGISKASNDWVLCIDADEILSDSLIREIRAEISPKSIEFAGFAFPRNLVFMGQVFKYGKEAHAPIIRLFNKKTGDWDGACVHEKLVLQGPVKTLKHKILHYSYQDYNQFLCKINLYSSLGASKLQLIKSRKNKFIVALGLPFNFIKYYLIDRNFLNGYRGFAWAVLNTMYHFVKYLKLTEIKNAVRKSV